MTRRLLSRDGACRYLSVGLSTLRRLEKCGSLPALRVGRKVLFDVDDLERFVARQRGSRPRGAAGGVPDEGTVEAAAEGRRFDVALASPEENIAGGLPPADAVPPEPGADGAPEDAAPGEAEEDRRLGGPWGGEASAIRGGLAHPSGRPVDGRARLHADPLAAPTATPGSS